MKIAASWYREGLGAALGVLVGALVLGTALPHGLRALAVGAGSAWQAVLLAVSALAALGGIATFLLVPAMERKAGAPLDVRALRSVVGDPKLRASVFGYFGHMWELYTMYALLPVIAATHFSGTQVSALAFWAIAAGFAGCAVGGLISRRAGSERVAAWQLATSGACCLLAPWLLDAPAPVFVLWLVVWGVTVVGDSPQFSTLTARNAPPHAVGSVLTIANSVGFAISVVSIEAFVRLNQSVPLAGLLPWLALGPALGLLALRPLLRPR
jgi:predicted MFS family arabinose efflux permease